MSDDYEVVGYILRKKEAGAGCLGALIVIVILGACIESCVGGKKNSGHADNPTYTESPPVTVQTGTLPVRDVSTTVSRIQQPAAPIRVVEQRIRCGSCSGRGIKNLATRCPTCNGCGRIVDQARTAQSAMQGIANGLARGRQPRPPRHHTYYMACPACNGTGRISHQDRCDQCGGNGSLLRR